MGELFLIFLLQRFGDRCFFIEALGGFVGGFEGLGFLGAGFGGGGLGEFFLSLFLERLGEGSLLFQAFGGIVGGLGLEAGFGLDLGLHAPGFFFGELLGRHFFAGAKLGLSLLSGALAFVLTAFEFRLSLDPGAFAGGGLGLGFGPLLGFLEDAPRGFFSGEFLRLGGLFEAAGGFVGLAFGAVGRFVLVAFFGCFAQAGDLLGDLAGLFRGVGFGTRLGDDGWHAGRRGLLFRSAGGMGDLQISAQCQCACQGLRKIHRLGY